MPLDRLAFGDRLSPWIVVLSSVVGFWDAFIGAAHRPLWFDELSTLLVASQHSVAAYFRLQPIDAQPPMEALLAHFALRLPLPVEICIRIPSMIAYLLAGWAIYFFLARVGTGLAAALGASSFLLGTPVLYAFEARPYALMMAFAALVLLCWQRAVWGGHRKKWTIAMAIGMALLTLSHAFGFMFAAIPIGLAELVRGRQNKKVDRRIAFAALLGLTPIFFIFWLSGRTKLLFLSQFHGARTAAAKPDLASLGFTLVSLRSAALQLVLLGAVLLLVLGTRELANKAVPRKFCEAEWVAVGGLFVAAIATWGFAVVYTHYYFPRYGCASLVAISLLSGMAFSLRGGRMRVLILWATQLGILLTFIAPMIRQRGTPLPTAAANSHAAALHGVPTDQLPIVVASGLEYQQVQRYADAALRTRLVFVTDPSQALLTQDFVPELVVDAYKDLGALNLPVEPYGRFSKEHSEFYVLTFGDATEWVPKALLRDGFHRASGGEPGVSRYER